MHLLKITLFFCLKNVLKTVINSIAIHKSYKIKEKKPQLIKNQIVEVVYSGVGESTCVANCYFEQSL